VVQRARRSRCLIGSVVAIVLGCGDVVTSSEHSPRSSRRQMDITLGGVTFDAARGTPTFDEAWNALEQPNGPDLHLVQLDGPTRDATIAALQQAGASIVRYVAPFSYIVWSDAATIDVVRGLPFVRAAQPFIPAFRIEPSLRTPDEHVLDLRVLICRNADVDAVMQRIDGCGAVCTSRASIGPCLEHTRVIAPAARLAEIARIPGVYSIKRQPLDGGTRGELSAQFVAGNVDGDGIAIPGYDDWLVSVGLDGTGVIIAHVDSGLADTHPDLATRILPCAGDTCGGDQESGHGSHTAGIIAGTGDSGLTDDNGFLRGLGVAPGASLVEQLYAPTYLQAGGMRTILREAVQNGAVISANSWGPSPLPLGYDDDTMQVDMAVRDADSTTPGHQPITYVLAIANGNGGVSTQGTPDEAKNVIRVGSTVMQLMSNGAQARHTGDISENSGHGPALDGRTLPDLVAPGCWVDSTIVSGLHNYACGTSMASPHVTGAIALFLEQWQSHRPDEPTPSPALIKASVLAASESLVGGADADGMPIGHAFENHQGWGRLDLDALVTRDPNTVVYVDQSHIFDESSETWSMDVEVAHGDSPVRVMLVWTDAPGHGLGGATPAWNNDLDLVIRAGPAMYRGNVFGPNGWSAAGGLADDRNNTEGVLLPTGTTGTLTIEVVASNIASDGVPGVGDITDQDFALVIVNASETSSSVSSCIADCAPTYDDGTWGNGVVNVDDLLAVLQAWGSDEARCDVAPTSADGTVGNGVVNIDDILLVIQAFGDCP